MNWLAAYFVGMAAGAFWAWYFICDQGKGCP